MSTTPKDSLISFLADMKAWESSYSSRLFKAADEDRFDDMKTIKFEAKDSLEKIFDAHCLKDKGDRRRLISVSMKEPTTYDPDRDQIESISEDNKKSIFEYRQTVGLKSKIRFELKKDNESSWKISTSTFYDETHQRWIRWML